MNVQAIRRFNRYYARILGVFNWNYLGAGYSVTEGRIIGEIGRNERITSQQLAEYLGLDKSYLSRIIRKFEASGLLERERSAEDGRKLYLHLTPQGQLLHEELDQRSDERIIGQLAGLSEAEREQLVEHMDCIRELLLPVLSEQMEE